LTLEDLRIVAVDPGKTTGWAILDGPLGIRFGESPFMEFHGRADNYLRLRHDTGHQVRVVCERFVITGGTVTVSRGDTNWSIETIGVVRYLADKYGHLFELQGAGDAKKLGSGELLRRLGWWSRGADHARDAARHLALALARHHPAEFDQLLVRSES
jgi:hypothetical protein